ncbi:hypothetical protein ACGRL8_17000 [Vibrio rumoiensis]|uniref:hypothetical protein n=1 Tax=Vibrio rumoiensis TaxID=76258 RepID=UPI00374A0CB2
MGLSDCIKNTCLLLEEGFNYHFIHKSIREYHSAKFISSSPNELKERFYTIAKNSTYKYRIELDFLSVIDEHYFNKYFLLPSYESIFRDLGQIESFNGINLNNLLNESYLYFTGDEKRLESFRLNQTPICSINYMNDAYNTIINLIIKMINNHELSPGEDNKLSIIKAITDCGLHEEGEAVINETIKAMHSRFIQMKNRFERKDALISSMDF